MNLKQIFVFAVMAALMLTVKAATDSSDAASPIDTTSNSVYAAMCAAGQSKYCGRVKPVIESGGTGADGEATAMDPTRDGIYSALCTAGKTAYCNRTDAGQTRRDNAAKCAAGMHEFCNQASGAGAGGSTAGNGNTGCASWGGGTGCAGGSSGGATGTGTGEAQDIPLLDTSTGTAVYDAMCKSGLTAYCGKTGGETRTPDQVAYDNSIKCILGQAEFCNQGGTGGATGGNGTTGCASWGGGTGCADGTSGDSGTGTPATSDGDIGTPGTTARNPAHQQAINDTLCRAGQTSYCTGGTTPTSTSGGNDGWQALMPELPVLSGDAKTACEVILCLAAGQAPHECINPLDIFFSIVKRTLSRTISARKDFLEQCPVVSDNDFLKQLTSAQAQGAGRCDVTALNQNYSYVGGGGEGGDSTAYVSSSMPSYCSAMANLVKNPMTGGNIYPLPVYVGVPERGGYWVDPKDYATAYASYTARVRAEDAAAAQGDTGGGP